MHTVVKIPLVDNLYGYLLENETEKKVLLFLNVSGRNEGASGAQLVAECDASFKHRDECLNILREEYYAATGEITQMDEPVSVLPASNTQPDFTIWMLEPKLFVAFSSTCIAKFMPEKGFWIIEWVALDVGEFVRVEPASGKMLGAILERYGEKLAFTQLIVPEETAVVDDDRPSYLYKSDVPLEFGSLEKLWVFPHEVGLYAEMARHVFKYRFTNGEWSWDLTHCDDEDAAEADGYEELCPLRDGLITVRLNPTFWCFSFDKEDEE